MFKFLGLLFLLSNTFAYIEDYHEKYIYEDEVYFDDNMPDGGDYVDNKIQKPKPTRKHVNDSINNVSGPDHNDLKEGRRDEVTISAIKPTPKYPQRVKRECNNTGDGLPCKTPVPDAEDDITTYPFMASILRMGSHYATGVFVDKRWVLTAAGLFYNVRESIKLFRVRLGSVNCKRGGVLVPLQKIVINPSYMLGKPNNDLAMLRLAVNVDFRTSIRPVSLTKTKGNVEINKFLTMYWPRLVIDGTPLPESAKERQQHSNMRVSTQRVIPWKQCWRAMSYRLQELTQNSFCLRPLKLFHTHCLADVGAPVLSQDGLWGIISGWVGEPCTLQDPSPVVVTRVTSPDVQYWVESQFELED